MYESDAFLQKNYVMSFWVGILFVIKYAIVFLQEISK